MESKIYRWIVLLCVCIAFISTAKNHKDNYEMTDSILQTQYSLMDMGMRNWHYAAGHEPLEQWKKNGIIMCPECYDWLKEQGKIHEPTVIITKKEHEELLERTIE